MGPGVVSKDQGKFGVRPVRSESSCCNFASTTSGHQGRDLAISVMCVLALRDSRACARVKSAQGSVNI